MSSTYQKKTKEYRDVDLTNAGYYYFIEWDNVTDEIRDKLADLEVWEGEDTGISAVDVSKHDLWACIIPGDYDYNTEERRFLLRELLKDAPYYLVMAHNCRWTGSSGYTIVDSIEKTLERSYDVEIYPVSVSRGGKCLICRESSHDVPMGARTSIIALTKREYEFLDHWNTAWEDVADFAKRCELKVTP